MEKFIRYTGGNLDRVSKERKNPQWVFHQLQRPDSCFALIWQNLNLISNFDGINGTSNNLKKKPHRNLTSDFSAIRF